MGKVTDKEIAEALEAQRKYNVMWNNNAGNGCPFGDTEFECEGCYRLFPRWAKSPPEKRLDHPCDGLTTKYVVRRCREFVKKYL